MICPYCKENIKDGAIKCKHCGSMLSIPITEKPRTVKCPFCREDIEMGLVKCIHCGSDLRPVQSPTFNAPINEPHKNTGIGYAVVSFILGLLGLGDVYRVASNQNEFSEAIQKLSGINPVDNEAMIGLGVLALFSILMGIIGIRKGKYSGATKGLAIAGIVCSILAVIIAFGIHLNFSN